MGGMAVPAPSIDTLLLWGFPLIPLARRSKCPVAKSWHERNFRREELGTGNIGTRLGQAVDIDGRSGTLFAFDFDSSDLELLKRLCRHFDLPRSTCVRTGGQHHGYHLFYLVEGDVRKSSGFAYHDASIDFMGRGSFVVLPPSMVECEYRLLIGFEEIAQLSREIYDTMREELRIWALLRRKISKCDGSEPEQFRALLGADPDYDAEMKSYAAERVAAKTLEGEVDINRSG